MYIIRRTVHARAYINQHDFSRNYNETNSKGSYRNFNTTNHIEMDPEIKRYFHRPVQLEQWA